jgi:cytochrome oxidase Cu insertion factor (SCO1/SenC/PrrC family)
MPGMGNMGNGLRMNDPTVVSAFHTALYNQGLVVLLILAALTVAWCVLPVAHARRAEQTGPGRGPEPGELAPEPDARRLLRIGFGLLWILDGILQGQASMPLGMVPQVISPTAQQSPGWVQHLVNTMATTWTYHPIVAATAAVWIQVGIGVWLLVAPRGNVSRLAGLASVGWGLTVWIFGESFGGIFAPGLSWLSGAPGAVLIYCFAGLLIALPEGRWQSPSLGRTILRIVGLFFVGMALLQAWPGRGFWHGSLASMVQNMSQTSQPHWLSSLLASFGQFDAAHGFAVNLFVVIALALVGFAFLTVRPGVVRVAVVAATLLCLADWVLVQDLGFLGGTGTDPNSMIPMVLVFVAGYLALSRVPATADARSTVPATAVSAAPDTAGGPARRPGLLPRAGATAGAGALWQALCRWPGRLVADQTYAFHSLAALGAIGVTVIGAAPMALAAINPNADAVLAKAANGPPEVTNIPTAPFSLVDQHGRRVSLASLHGKTVALTFLDPGCTHQAMGCATAQVLRLADGVLGTSANRVELVAINTSPTYFTSHDLVRFDGHAGFDNVDNWLFLTGPLSALRGVLNDFAIHVSDARGMGMGLPHGQVAYVIDGSGRTREVLSIGDRGAVSNVMESSTAVSLANAVERVSQG